jgi:5-methylcytosine-specific restriction enzyme subunit McrC
MEIPIQNIYFLLCYAWNKLDESEVVNVKSVDSTELVDLFAKVLINGITHLLKRGIYRDYLEHENIIRSVKGKINFGNSCRKNLFRNGQAYCHYDEMDHNVIHNQILKVTLLNLIRVKQLDDTLRDQLITLFRYFHQIDTINLSSNIFRSVRVHRNNYFYLFLLNICELIHESLLIDENTGDTKFKDFMRDEKKMAHLFEEFVRNFYKIELTDYSVSRENIHWKFEGTEEGLNLLPKMQTDISLESNERKIIIDTKFYKDAFSHNFEAEKFIQGHIMQLFSYLTQSENEDPRSKTTEGVLLYPTVYKSFTHDYVYENHKIRLCTINLNQDWKEIHMDLLSLIYGH